MAYRDTDKINVDNWSVFIQNNEDIVVNLNKISTDVADMLANVATVVAESHAINAELAKLKTTSTIPQLTVTGEYEKSCVEDLIKNLSEKSIKVIVGINYAESMLESYNSGDTSKAEAWGKVYDVLSDSGAVLGTIAEALAKTDKYKEQYALNFILSASTDLLKKELSGSTIENLVAALSVISNPATESMPTFWKNSSIGTGVAIVVNCGLTFLTDKGEWNKFDWYRVGFDVAEAVGSSVISTAVSGAIADAMFYSAASSWGGPVGVVGGALVVYPLSLVYSDIKDMIVGDKIIDKFELGEGENRTEYLVPRNGRGEDYTYDIFLEQYHEAINKWKIGDTPVTEDDYYKTLYGNWVEFVERDTDEPIDLYGGADYPVEEINNVLEQIRNAPSYDDDADFFGYYNQLGMHAQMILRDLMLEYDFTFENYYNYFNGGGFSA